MIDALAKKFAVEIARHVIRVDEKEGCRKEYALARPSKTARLYISGRRVKDKDRLAIAG